MSRIRMDPLDMKGIRSRIVAYMENLRFPVLLIATDILLTLNIFIPDAFPFIDEIVLALVAVLLGRIKRRPDSRDEN